MSDHWTITAMPRLELMIGGVNHVAFMLPVSLEYGWYVF
jgi:hypothetical protein